MNAYRQPRFLYVISLRRRGRGFESRLVRHLQSKKPRMKIRGFLRFRFCLLQTQPLGQTDQVGAVDAQFAGGGGPFVLMAVEGLADQLFLVGVDGFA